MSRSCDGPKSKNRMKMTNLLVKVSRTLVSVVTDHARAGEGRGREGRARGAARKQAREVAREHANDLATASYKGVEERHREGHDRQGDDGDGLLSVVDLGVSRSGPSGLSAPSGRGVFIGRVWKFVTPSFDKAGRALLDGPRQGPREFP